jgi:hypothetical protein
LSKYLEHELELFEVKEEEEEDRYAISWWQRNRNIYENS